MSANLHDVMWLAFPTIALWPVSHNTINRQLLTLAPTFQNRCLVPTVAITFNATADDDDDENSHENTTSTGTTGTATFISFLLRRSPLLLLMLADRLMGHAPGRKTQALMDDLGLACGVELRFSGHHKEIYTHTRA